MNFFSGPTIDKLKYAKDQGSFWRLIFNIVINILYVRRYSKKKKELQKKMIFMKDQIILSGSEEARELDQLLNYRFELKNAYIEIFHSSVRIVMLWKSLQFTG